MKTPGRFLIFASAFLALVSAYPGGIPSGSESDEDNEKVGPIIVLSELSNPLEDGFGTGFFGSIQENPFNGFLAGMQNMMHKLREQIAKNIPAYSSPGSFFSLTNGPIPEGANSTSTTKVIDGHLVTVNETTYSDLDNGQGTLIRVRVVDIKPNNDEVIGNPDEKDLSLDSNEEEITGSPTTGRSVESVENVRENEIPERLVDIKAV